MTKNLAVDGEVCPAPFSGKRAAAHDSDNIGACGTDRAGLSQVQRAAIADDNVSRRSHGRLIAQDE